MPGKMKRNIITALVIITLCVSAFVYAEYWKYRYEAWFEIYSYKDSGWLSVELMEKYAEDCEMESYQNIKGLLSSNLELYENRVAEVTNIPFVDGQQFQKEHLETISKIKLSVSSVNKVAISCKNI